MWEKCIQTALLGTERKSFSIQNLPEELRNLIEKRIDLDSESQFLMASGMLYWYERAGKLFPKIEISPITIEIKEDEKISLEGEKILAEFLHQKNKFLPVLHNLLEKYSEKNIIFSPNSSISLLDFGLKNNILREKILKTIGKKGNAIIHYKEDWKNFYQIRSPEQIWNEGLTGERHDLFEELRISEPTLAFSFLERTWEHETAPSKKFFIEKLAINLSKNELFQLSNWKKKYSSKLLEKAINRTIVKKIASYEVFLGENSMNNRAEKILDYCKIQIKKIIGITHGQRILIELPTQEDEFFCSEIMVNEFGFEPKNPDFHTFETVIEYWFSELLSLLDISKMSTRFNSSITQTLNLLLKENTLKTIQNSVEKSLENFGTKDWIMHYLPFTEHLSPILFQKFTPAEQEEFLIMNPKKMAQIPFYALKFSWSYKLSILILGKLAEEMDLFPTVKEICVRYLDSNALLEMNTFLSNKSSEWKIQKWQEIYNFIVEQRDTFNKIKSIE